MTLGLPRSDLWHVKGGDLMIFNDKLAVITGGSSGIGRALAVALAKEGCHLALCATSENKLLETKSLCESVSPETRTTTHRVDVSDEAQLLAFRDEVCEQHATDHINLLINNAGVTGEGSFVAGPREQWERIFNINWNGVYYGTRTFLPMLCAAEQGCIVNISSVCGLWASSSAYGTSKFVVRGFTESLIYDLRQHAPHVKAAVVIPGKVKTDLIAESQKHVGNGADQRAVAASQAFSDSALTTAEEAAAIILDGIRAGKWRILVGADAEELDKLVRETPDEIYDEDFVGRITRWR